MNFPVFLTIVTLWVVKICSPHPLLVGNSSTVRPGDFAYQSVIRFTSDDKVFLLCEGAIIDKKWILTAAGCLDKYESESERMDVVAGITSTENIESEPHAQVKTVSHINISPLWIDSKKKAGDLALIELLKPFTFNKFVNKAIFGENGTVNEVARLIGYGQSKNLSVTELKIISKQECNLETNNNAAELICAKQNSNRYAFNDESFAGAPLVNSTNSDSSRDEVIGIVSAKSRHFTSIAYHKTWIENVAKIKSSNTEDTNESDTSDEKESYVSDDGGVSVTTNSTKSQTSTTRSTVSGDEDSNEDEDESESESSETSKEPSKEDSSEDSTLDESSEETTTSSSASEQSEEIEDSDSTEDNATAEDTSKDSSESSASESLETTTSPSSADSSDESESESDDSESSSTESQSTTTTTSYPDTTQTNAPTSTPTPAPTTAKPVSTTETPSTTTSPTSTSTSQPNATTAATTVTPTTEPTTTATSASTNSEESDSDYSDDSDSNSHNRDQNSHNSFDKDNNNKISPDNSAGSNAVTSNSAQPSNPSFISTMISKSSNLFNSIKKFKTFIVA